MHEKLVIRAEIPQREWIEFEFETDGELIKALRWKAQACHFVLEQATKFTKQVKNKNFKQYKPQFSQDHAGLLMAEVWGKLKKEFVSPKDDLEICHCRKINEDVIDRAVVLGAHTPEKVKEWTSASSGCGTCRNEVQKIIQKRLNK